MSTNRRKRLLQPQLLYETDAEYQTRHAAELAADRLQRAQERAIKDAQNREWAETHPGYVPRTRPYRTYPPILPGRQFSRPADPTAAPGDPTSFPSPPVTILSRVAFASALSRIVKLKSHKARTRTADEISPATESTHTFSNGLWNVLCFCGATYQASTHDLNRLQPWALHCPAPACSLPRKRRAQNFATRPGAERHLNQTYGRLYVQEWVQREGWLCLCTPCGTQELVRRSVELGAQGYKRCPHV